MKSAISVARFYANSDYANLNCRNNSDNSNSTLGITYWFVFILNLY